MGIIGLSELIILSGGAWEENTYENYILFLVLARNFMGVYLVINHSIKQLVWYNFVYRD